MMQSNPANGLAPILYLPHGGGPLPLLGDPAHAAMVAFLRAIPAQLGRPEAILLISAHWETARPSLTAAARPSLIYDYTGFPPESYAIRYPAPGSPELAGRVHDLLEQAGRAPLLDAERGFDHGLFVPLKLMYPEADLPCVQLSLTADLDPAAHLELGRALAPLRRENILIVGSGLSFHNLRAFFQPGPQDLARSQAFNDWLVETCTGPGLSAPERAERLIDWSSAPHARFCHPRAEHLLPLHLCFGAAAATPRARLVFDDRLMGMQACGLLW